MQQQLSKRNGHRDLEQRLFFVFVTVPCTRLVPFTDRST